MFTTNPELQIEIEKLSEQLRHLPIGSTASYGALKDGVGGSYSPWALIRARKAVEDETGLRFATVRSVGIKKLAAADVTGIGSEARARIGRVAKSQSKRLANLKYNDLSPEDRAKIDMERSLLGAIHAASSIKSLKAVAADATTTGPQIAAAVFKALAKD
jgi:hypothetical protein